MFSKLQVLTNNNTKLNVYFTRTVGRFGVGMIVYIQQTRYINMCHLKHNYDVI